MIHAIPRVSALGVVLIAALWAVPASALPARAGAASVTVTLGKPGEYALTPAKRTLKAGKVTFVVTNKGAITHEMNVIPVPSTGTVLARGKSAGQVREKGKIGAVEGLKTGQTGRVAVTLERGTYQLFCNIPGHYMKGMRTVITVT